MAKSTVTVAPAELLALELFQGLGASDVALLCMPERVVRFARGAVVFKQGDPADHLLLVVQGQLRAWAEVGGRSEPVADVFAGELVGEAALFPNAGRRTATLKSASATVALRLTRADLDALSGSKALAAIQRRMLQSTARRLRTTNHAMRRIWKRARETEAAARSSEARKPKSGLWSQFVSALGGLT